MTSRAREQQDSCWLHSQLSWYCPRFCHMRAFVFLGIPGKAAPGPAPPGPKSPRGSRKGVLSSHEPYLRFWVP